MCCVHSFLVPSTIYMYEHGRSSANEEEKPRWKQGKNLPIDETFASFSDVPVGAFFCVIF